METTTTEQKTQHSPPPIKLRVEGMFKSMDELVRAWYNIIAVSNNISLTRFETDLLISIRNFGEGKTSIDVKRQISSHLSTSIASINNSISSLKKKGFISKEGEISKELNFSFTNPSLILIKYGVQDVHSG